MKELRMIDWFESLNDGLDTIIGEKGCKLSSGLKQRVNIIRTILRMRENLDEFIILDEITSNLDAETERVAIKMIDRECKGGTMMIISHHGGFNEICDSHITVENHKFYQDEYNNTLVKNIAQ
jgi:ABC-type multidrug transport system fused ATPase/permease subunit